MSRAAWRIYADRRMLAISALGLSSGLPRLLVYSTLTFWLMRAGASLEMVGLFGLTSAPYTLKFLAAPWLDSRPAPLFGRLGLRRGWLLLLQLGLMAALLAAASLDPARQLGLVAASAGLIASLSALQDVVVDALRIELLEGDEQGAGAAAAVFGYRVGMLIAGAGALGLFALTSSWPLVYMLMGGIMALCAGVTLVIAEPERDPRAVSAPAPSLRAAARDLGALPEAGLMLVLVMTYKLGDALAGAMLNPLLISLGFDELTIAGVVKTWGLGASLAGAGLGGWLVKRLGLMRALWIAGFMQLFSNLVFTLQAVAGADVRALIVTVGTENICGGVGTAAFVALLSTMCKREMSATQYALLTAMSSLLVTLLTSPMGLVARLLGWPLYFVFTALCAAPGLIALRVALRRQAASDGGARRRALEQIFE